MSVAEFGKGIAAAVVAALALISLEGTLRAAGRPNVLFLAVDDLNDWIGCLGGHPQAKTPNIDRLAARGTLFTRAYCAAPACNPSRAALMTGRRASTSGVYLNSQPWRPAMPDVATLAQTFQSHYDVLGCGKIFHGGFNDPASWHRYQKQLGDPKPIPAVADDPRSRAGGIIWGALDVDDAEMSDYKMADWAIDVLKQKHDKPFFLACGFYRPHMPWNVPRKYYDLFPLESIVLPETRDDDLDDVPATGVAMAKPGGDHATVLKTDNWKRAVQAYLACHAFADAQVGRLIDALDQSDYRDNTIIVLWGDHGWHLGEKQHWRKFALWEEATRAPLMFVVPGVTPPGSRCERTVDFMNLYPTLCELCELPVPAGVEGHSLVPLLKNPQAAWAHPAITTHGRNNHAVRTERYRYIRYADGSEELYNHERDPHEWTNLAAQPALAAVKNELAGHLAGLKNAPNAANQAAIRARGAANRRTLPADTPRIPPSSDD